MTPEEERKAVAEKLSKLDDVSQFAALGAKLLEDTEKPNKITLAQFEPYLPLFNVDQTRLNSDREYRTELHRLLLAYWHVLGINKHQPTMVVVSDTDDRVVHLLPRMMTRVASDEPVGESHRAKVPVVVPRNGEVQREQMFINASILDLVERNKTPEQLQYFNSVRNVESYIQKKFVERSMTENKRQELLQSVETSQSDAPTVSQTFDIEFLDDDD